MDKVQKPSDSECHTPSSEHCRFQQVLSFQYEDKPSNPLWENNRRTIIKVLFRFLSSGKPNSEHRVTDTVTEWAGAPSKRMTSRQTGTATAQKEPLRDEVMKVKLRKRWLEWTRNALKPGPPRHPYNSSSSQYWANLSVLNMEADVPPKHLSHHRTSDTRRQYVSK
jgi:hypothetical protein